jgi:hypothetical protein
MPGDGDVEGAGPRVFFCASPLEEHVGRSVFALDHDPDVKAPVPIAVAVHEGALLLTAEGRAVSGAEVEELVVILRGHG